MKEVKEEINKFTATLGCTDILTPLMKAVSLDIGNRKKRIFLLTDGEVGNKSEIIEFAKNSNKITKIHTFGIGDGCDRKLVSETAYAGRGSCNFAAESTKDLLSG
jgi:hypothetical protein